MVRKFAAVILAAAGAAASTARAVEVFTVPEASQRLLGLSFAEAEMRNVAAARSFPGKFEIPPHARHAVAAAAPGRIKLMVREGQAVKRGDALFTIESGAWLRLNGELAAKRAELAVARKELEIAAARVELLRGAEARNPELEREAAVKPLAIAQLEAEIAALEAQVRLALRFNRRGDEEDALVAFAPVAGRVESLRAENGAWAEEGATVVTLAEDGRIRFRADVPAIDFAHLGEIAKDYARVAHVCSSADAAHDESHAEVSGGGTLEAGVSADASSLVPLYFTPEKFVEWMQSGVAGELTVIPERARGAKRVAVPDGAVVSDGTGFCVYVKTGADKFVKLAVTPGAHANGWTEVEGAHAGMKVVVNGAYELKLLAPGSGKKKVSGHFHADGQFHEGSHDGEAPAAADDDDHDDHDHEHEHGPGCSHVDDPHAHERETHEHGPGCSH